MITSMGTMERALHMLQAVQGIDIKSLRLKREQIYTVSSFFLMFSYSSLSQLSPLNHKRNHRPASQLPVTGDSTGDKRS